MVDASDAVYVETRRQLRGVAESLIAGPQYRAAGTIRLAVRPDGFAGVAVPLSVRGTQLVWPNGAANLNGRVDELAKAADITAGPPDGVYEIVDPLSADTLLDIDAAAADWVYRSHYAGGHAIKNALPEGHPVLWPEHFDVAATDDEVNYGVSAGDDYHQTPYAYVGPWTQRSGTFWNAPFGAFYPLDPAHDVDTLASRIADFFRRGQEHL
ncbi:hypothetical protein A5724_02900 [Mycobacterium sp. ACS1612]|uniref:hypothetical protein n=1 Tax=Mycobacterium sp. ACS1612 TaxID=1834117 RepID=UPI0007FDC5D3|nr:hypothetical protein [Mycobacterium sp. ACS1612]OBF27022.1 hypothetical protein A5724_02900 [Mycobacterium sp. ACS1612]